MAWHPPELRVEFAADKHPLDPPESADWGTIDGVRLRELSVRAGRQDDLDQMEEASYSLRCSDPGGSLEASAGTVGALTPVRVLADWTDGAGTDHTDVSVFTGFCLDGPAPSPNARERDRSVSIEATDWMGWAAGHQMPDSMLAYWVTSEDPVVWWRGDADYSNVKWSVEFRGGGTASETWTVFDHGSEELDATDIRGTLMREAECLTFDGSQPSLLSTSDGGTVTVIGNTDELTPVDYDFTVACAFQSFGTFGGGANRVLWSGQSVSPLGTTHWDLHLGASGTLSARAYDAAGGQLAAAALGGPYDDATPHVAVAQFRQTAVHLWGDLNVGTVSASYGGGTLGGSGGYFLTGDAGLSPLEGEVYLQELSYWDSLVDPPDIDGGTVVAPLAPYRGLPDVFGAPYFYGLWAGDTTTERVDNLLGMTGATIVHEEHDPAVVEWRAVRPNATLADQVRQLSTSMFGASYVLRDGTLRLRDRSALTDATYADDYETPAAWVTDDESPPAGSIVARFSNRGRTGERLDRVINEVVVGAEVNYDLGAASVLSDTVKIRGKAPRSQDDWGPRVHSVESILSMTDGGLLDLDAAESYIASILAERASPTVEIGPLTIQPWGINDATQFCLIDLELEKAVHFTESTPDGVSSTLDGDYRVQGYQWDWSEGTGWAVQLTLSPIPEES